MPNDEAREPIERVREMLADVQDTIKLLRGQEERLLNLLKGLQS